MPRDVRRGVAVAGRRHVLVLQPGHSHVDAQRPELHRRLRVVVEDVRVAASCAATEITEAYTEGKLGMGMLLAAVTSMTLLEIRQVRKLVEHPEEVPLGGAQAQVADLHAVVDRPLQAAAKTVPLPLSPAPSTLTL